jgi:SAM-dependent methyltransferase
MTGARPLRRCFDDVAELYARVRPGYPASLVESLLAGVPEGGTALEVGCGTGQLTQDLVLRGLSVHALELGENLAAEARRRVPTATIEVGDFELWEPPRTFDLLASAQAFHWIDPECALSHAARALAVDGWLGLLWTLDRSQDTELYRATNPVYERFPTRAGPPLRDPVLSYPGRIEASSQFGSVIEVRRTWDRTWTQAEWLDQVRTFSSTLSLDLDRRGAFLSELAEVIAAQGGEVTRHYEGVLLLTQRR